MTEEITMGKFDEEKYRVVTLLNEEEKDALQELAWSTQRSVSGYLRYMVIMEIAKYADFEGNS